MLFQSSPGFASEVADERILIYVATDGSDYNDGSKNRPFATITRARDEIREMKANGQLAAKGAVVYIRGGLYKQLETVELGEEDGGENGRDIVYRAYPGENVILIGGINVPIDKIKKTEDKSVLDKVIDASARNKIYEIDLFDAGFSDIPKIFYSENYGMTSAYNYGRDPENLGVKLMEKLGIDITTSPFELIVNNNVYSNARYPNVGTMTIARGVTSSYIKSAESGHESEIIKEYLDNTVKEKPVFVPSDTNRSKLWTDRDLDQVYIWFEPGFGWAEEGNMVESVDKDGKITCAMPTFYGPWEEGNPCYIYNFFDEISDKEYYIDKNMAKLYLCLDKRPEEISDITLTTMDNPIFHLKDTQNIKIENLQFSKTKSNSVLIQGSKNCCVDNCEISYTSIAGADIKIEDTEKNISTNCGVKNCYFHDVNGGVYIWAGDKATLTRGNNYIINNTFENFSRIKTTYNPAFVLEGVGNRAAYNKVYGSEHMAASWGGNYQMIEFNEFYDVCTNTDDAAAMYAGQSLEPRGNTIRYNYLHDVGRTGQSGGQRNGSHAIYLDDGYSSAYVVGNVFSNIANYGVFVGGGRDNVIFNNMMINCGGFIFCDSRFAEGWTEIRVEPLKNHGYWRSDIWKEAFPELYNMDIEKAGIAAGNVFEGNLSYKSGATNISTIAVENGTVKNNYVTTSDPGFVDLENGNFTLKEDSEVFTKISDFMPIPFTRMGNCIDRAMQRIIPATVIAIDSPNAFVNGELQTIDDDLSVKPKIYNDRTYLPLRFLAEANGFDVDYNDETKTAHLKNESSEMYVNIQTGEITVNGENKDSIEPIIVADRTLLPLRAISELLQKQVFWDNRGFISISEIEDLFNSETDDEIIDYLYSQLSIY
jgi:hypothetical protein